MERGDRSEQRMERQTPETNQGTILWAGEETETPETEREERGAERKRPCSQRETE